MKQLLYVLVLAAACSSPVSDQKSYYSPSAELHAKIENEIQLIRNSHELTEYLENIHQLDQRYRNEETLILQEYGHNSKEHKDLWKKIKQVDAENYSRVEAILEKFGYPNIDSVGREAAIAPWLVIHHSPVYEHRTKHFRTIYHAYLKGNLDRSAFNLFLDRMHHMKYKESFHMPSPYQLEDKIDTLIQILELEDLIDH